MVVPNKRGGIVSAIVAENHPFLIHILSFTLKTVQSDNKIFESLM